MIHLEGTFDHNELASDMVGGWKEGKNEVESRGVIVWKDPWDWRGWEFTEGFLKKWGFLMKGCEEAIEATNNWRMVRGEQPLMITI